MKIEIILIQVLLFLFIIFVICVMLIKRFVYFHPNRNITKPPPEYVDVFRGKVHGWYHKGTTGKVILYCHGNSGNISGRIEQIEQFRKRNHSVVIFDYHGYGRSEGIPSEKLCYRAAELFVDFLLEKGYDKNQIIVYGMSLGGPVAVYIARKYGLHKVVLVCPLPSVSRLIKHSFSWAKPLAFLFPEFNTEDFIRGYKGQTFLLYCPYDTIIPSQSLYKIKKECSQVIVMDGSHNQPNIPWDKVLQFIEK